MMRREKKKISKYETQPTQLVSAVKLYIKTGLNDMDSVREGWFQ